MEFGKGVNPNWRTHPGTRRPRIATWIDVK